jgi:hypothetical protein
MSTKMTTTQSLLAIALTFSLSTPLYAANTCKGIQEQACDQSDSCTWIKTYKRKDGANIKAYCRSKPNKKAKLTKSVGIEKKTKNKQTTTKKSATTPIENNEKLIKKVNDKTSTTSN